MDLLDKGTITEEEAIRRIQDRLPNERLRKLAKECLDCWHEYNISPKPGMEKVVRDLKAKGYRMYVCSNASLRFRVFQNEIPGFSLMEGALVSAEEKLLKPDPAIYRRLFERFDIRPEESFFIDDIQENIGRGEGLRNGTDTVLQTAMWKSSERSLGFNTV